MDQTLKKQMTHTIMLAGDFRTASRKFPWKYQILFEPDKKFGFVIKGFSVILSKLNVVELNSLKTASSFPCSRGWLTIWLYLSWSQSASILIHRIINGHIERERTCVAKDSRKCHSSGSPWWVEFPRSRYWKPMRKGRDVRKHFVPELFLSLLTLSPDSLDSRTRCVTAHTKMNTQWKASETRKR